MTYHLRAHVGATVDAAIQTLGSRVRIVEAPAIGRLVEALAGGAATREHLANSLPEVPQETLDFALSALLDAGLATQGALPPHLADRWASLEIPSTLASAAIVSGIRVTGFRLEPFVSALAAWGLLVSTTGRLHLQIVPDLTALADAALDVSCPTVLVAPTADGAYALVRNPDAPGRPALRRVRFNQPAATLAPTPHADHALDLPTVEAITHAVARVAVGMPSPFGDDLVRLVRGTVGRRHAVRGREVSDLDRHPLRRQTAHAVDPLTLFDRVTGLCHSPREVGRVGPAVAVAVRHRVPDHARSIDELKAFETRVSGGKGWDLWLALASGAWEAAERISGRRHSLRPARVATARQIGNQALLPETLDNISDAQRSGALLTPTHPMLRIPTRLDPDLPVDWVRAWALNSRQPHLWTPAAGVFYGYDSDEHPYAFAHSNGAAGAPTYPEAALWGLLELVERDAAAIHHYSRTPRPPSLAQSARIDAVRAALRSGGRDLYLLDLTHDLGVPVCAAVSRRRNGLPGWVIGYGADLDATAAAERAVLEVGQLLPATDAPHAKSPLPWANDPSVSDYLIPDREAVRTPHADPHGDPLQDLLRRFQGAGFEAYAVDQTHPAIGVPTLKMLVPGLLFFWRRFGGGRIGRVPVDLGWRSDVVAESEYNPFDLTV